jgi:hypothetical protein
VKNLPNSASLHSEENNAPSMSGIKHRFALSEMLLTALGLADTIPKGLLA